MAPRRSDRTLGGGMQKGNAHRRAESGEPDAMQALRGTMIATAALAILIGCNEGDRAVEDVTETPAEERIAVEAAPVWRQEPEIVRIETMRYDRTWRTAPSVDSIASIDTTPVLLHDSVALSRTTLPDSLFEIPEVWEDLGEDGAWTGSSGADPIHLPLGGEVSGPSVLKAQVLLDRAGFSPGVIDGRWGGNVERAVFWLQRREGLRPTGSIDAVTLERIRELGSNTAPLVGVRVLRAEDVEGPFTDIPEDVYERDDLECLCPESALEKVAERAHTTSEVLRQLNPGLATDDLAAGDSLRVPLVGAFLAADGGAPRVSRSAETETRTADSAARGDPSLPQGDSTADPSAVHRIVVSDRGRYLHAFDAGGRLLFHFPATLGSDYNPSPQGRLEVTSVTFDPWFHYQPELLDGADPDAPSTRLAPGPNSPVGTVWIALSREHYGIHGTSAPQSIGYVTSSGCVRLTNWDAEQLARHVGPGTIVEFRDVREGASADTATVDTTG